MRSIIIFLSILWSCAIHAQNDSSTFHTYLYNKEYKVYLRINFYDQDVIIPDQDLLGPLPGYLGKEHNSFCWPIVSVEVKGKKAHLQMVNDYGSEDLEATLTRENDSIYILKQGKGSVLKVPNNNKWQKLPNVLPFVRPKRQ
ncbi:hypothetical protein [Prevotella sp. E2-28]|uniref:hypothetical protein n=1 Tax=Prevotella sp. E2-28 TaxID=2913620 RepID=UPI001EDA8FE9|nr:hypothetical protein [Prevotella sp. E2-28]UKK54860.1 hypothetical protein L6465_06290 [Prevotella sp. E2-28]